MKSTLLVLAFAISSSVGSAQGLGSYLNFESPVVRPLTIATIDEGGTARRYLLACYTPDNSVRVYDIGTSTSASNPSHELRIPVGPEPVSVAFRKYTSPTTRYMMYTANWLGNSVSIVELFSSSGTPSYKMIGTYPVTSNVTEPVEPVHDGAEPVHVLPFSVGSLNTLIVAKRSASSFALLDAFTGQGISPNLLDTIMTDDGAFTPTQTPTGDVAVKEPHVIGAEAGTTGRFWVLGHKGGGNKDSAVAAFPTFDVDLWTWNPFSTPPLAPRIVSGLGTNNFNMAFSTAASNERFIYVVGTDAQNDVVGNANLSGLATGFVQTKLYRVNVSQVDNASPTFAVQSRDLNTDTSGNPVASSSAIVQATDVAIYRTAVSGGGGGMSPTKDYVCLVGFNSDRFAVVDASSGNGSTWSIWREDIPRDAPAAGEMAGPRGLAISTSTDRAYILNTIEPSIVTLDLTKVVGNTNPTDATLAVDPIDPTGYDPVPEYIRDGKKFLFGAHFGNGFNSCAVCHIDARSDNLTWRLTAEDVGPFAETAAGDSLDGSITTNFSTTPVGDTDGFEVNDNSIGSIDNVDEVETLLTDGFSSDGDNAKGAKVTQSLQGLLNGEVDCDDKLQGSLLHRFSNAPYHWRGDKQTFLDFNEAFVGLLGGSLLDDSPGDELEMFQDYIGSIHYPPNPLERLDRTYSGELGDPDDFTDVDGTSPTSTGAKAGLKLFHILPVNEFGTRSCIHCHHFPTGSDNRWTEIQGSFVDDPPQPINTPAIRGLRQKEARLELESTSVRFFSPGSCSLDTTLTSGEFGLGHEGNASRSINDFLSGVLNALDDLGTGTSSNCDDTPRRTAFTRFVREYDTGVAPIVGRGTRLNYFDINNITGEITTSAKETFVELMESQVLAANAGLIVQIFDGQVLTEGYYYSPLNGNEYRQAGGSTTYPTKELLLKDKLQLHDIVIFTACPLGSERRYASTTGVEATPADASSLVIEMSGTTPNTANVIVPGLSENFAINPGTWPSALFPIPASERALVFLHATCQTLNLVPSTTPGHDASRRLQFEITGTNVREGGRVRIGIDMVGGSGSEPANSSQSDFQYVELPVYPRRTAETVVWETAVELEPVFVYVLLLGGPAAPGVAQALSGDDTLSTGAFDPTNWNQYDFQYIAPDGDVSTTLWPSNLQPLLYPETP